MKRLCLLALLLTAVLPPVALITAAFALADDSVFLENTEKVDIEKPLLRVTRPGREWVFLNLPAAKKQALERAGSAKGGVEDAFMNLKVQLQLSSAKANFYVYAWPDARADASAEKAAENALESTRGFFKDKGKVLSSGKTKLGKLDAYGFELEGALVSSGEDFHVAKIAVYRPEDKTMFLLALEVPKKTLDKVKKDRKKLFSPEAVKLQ